MHGKRYRHVSLFGCFQKTHHGIHRRVLVMMAAVTGIGLLVDTAGFKASLRKHEPEGVTVGVCGLTDTCDSGHMTAHTAAEGVNAVHRAVLHGGVTALAQPVFKQPRLGARTSSSSVMKSDFRRMQGLTPSPRRLVSCSHGLVHDVFPFWMGELGGREKSGIAAKASGS